MALQLDVNTRNARLDAIESAIGVSPSLKLISGAVPADTSATDGGTVLVTIPLPADWMAAASAGSKAKIGTWQALATTGGTIGHYRIFDSGSVCRLQGTVTITGGGGDMTVDNLSVAANQQVTVVTYVWNEGNA